MAWGTEDEVIRPATGWGKDDEVLDYEFKASPVTAGLESLISLGTGSVAQIPAGLAGIASTIGNLSMEKGADTVKSVSDALTYQPITKRGQEWTQNTAEILNKPVEWAGAGGEAIAGNEGRLVGEIAGNFALDLLPFGAAAVGIKKSPVNVPKTPPNNPKIDALDKIIEAKKVEQPTLFGGNDEVISTELPVKIDEDPSVVAYAKEQARIKEMEAKGLGDVMYADQAGNVSPELSKKIESTPREVEAAKVDQFTNLEEAAKQLEEPSDTQLDMFEPTQGRIPFKVPQSQRGAINAEVFESTYKKAKEVGNFIYRTVGVGDNTARVEVYKKEDPSKPVAITKFSATNWMNPEKGDVKADWVQVVPEYQKQKISQEMYKFIAEQGNDMVPSKAQTGAGRGLWNQLEREGISQGMKIPKGQRGALDWDSISKGVQKLAGRVVDSPSIDESRPVSPRKPAKATPTVSETLQETIPGIKQATKDYIPDDPDISVVLEEAKKENDSNMKYTWLKSGATLTAAQTKSTVIKAVGRYFQNAGKRAERNIRNIVQPAEKAFRNLNKPEVAELAEVFKKEMFNGELFTPKELMDAGFSPNQIDAYTAVRDMYKAALEKQNASRAEMGMKPVTAKEAYLSSRWQGDWRVVIYDSNGRPIWAIADRSKKGVEKAIDYLEKNTGIKVDKTKSKITYKKGATEAGDLQNSYLSMLEMLDKNDPRVEAIKSVMEEAMANDAFSTLAQQKHFEKKQNVRGFIGDRPWMNRTEDAYEMFQQQFQYAKNGFNWAELQQASNKVKEIVNDPDIQENQPINVGFARDYSKQALGYGEMEAIGVLEKEAARLLGQDRQRFYNVVGDMKNLFITQKLSVSLGYTLQSLIQPTMTAAWHARLTAEGFKHNAAKSTALGMQDGLAVYLKHVSEQYTGKELPAPMSKIGEEALKYAEDNGIVSRDIYDEAANLGKNPVVEGLQNTLGVTVSHPEKIARTISFMSFVHHLDQSGAFKDNKLGMFQKAEEYTIIAMSDYRRSERPMVFEKLGVTGSALGTLQTFKFNYLNQLHTLSKFAAEGNPRPLLTFLGLQAAVGGMVSMPALEELDSLFQTVKGILPHDAYKEVSDFSPKGWLIENLPEWAAYGGVSKVTGANMSTRFDMSNIADFSFDQTFPFLSDIYQQGQKASAALMNPTESTIAESLYASTPPGLQGLVETGMDAFKVGDNRSGTQLYKNPKDVVAQDAKFERTPGQEMYRKFGLREMGESKKSESEWRQSVNEKIRADRLKTAGKNFFDAIARKSDKGIEKYAIQYIELGGDAAYLDDIMKRELLKQNILPSTLAKVKAKSVSAIEKAQRMYK
jgi:hypothetical protein